jgi:acyl-CoA synthetase (AMP-forming)/AMP-acid ligase II
MKEATSILLTAFIVLRNGCSLDPAAIKQYLKGHLAGYKVPKEYIVMDKLPKSSAGKVLKRELKNLV